MLVNEALVAVISLPAGVFQPYSGVKTSILILDKSLAKKTKHIGFFKVENDGFDLGAQRRPTESNDLPQVQIEVLDYLSRLNAGKPFDDFEPSMGLVVTKETIAENGEYNLNGERFRQSTIQISKYPLMALGDLCDFVNGRAFKPEDWARADSGGLPIVRIQNLNTPDADFNYYTGEVSDKYIINTGQLLFSWSGSRGTSFGAHIWNGGQAILNQHIFSVGFDSSRVTKMYLFHALNMAVAAVEDNLHGGVGLVHITKGNLEKIKVPVPPLSVQQEIVAEIESYQKVIDGARAVLDNYRPRIVVDPEWPMMELKDACSINPRKTEVSDLDPLTTVSFVPMSDVGEHAMFFDWKETKRLDEVTASYTYFRDNDVLVAKVTPCFENGKGGIARNLQNGIGFGSSELYVLRPTDTVLSEWVYMCVSAPAFHAWATPKMTGTGGLQRVPKSVVESYLIPVPPIETQKSIVAEIETEQELVNANRELITRFEQKIQTVLARVWGEDEDDQTAD